MLKGEQEQSDLRTGSEPLTYGSYLRVPELLSLQSPLGNPLVHDEMLFIIVQQVQELWFKQMMFDLKAVIASLEQRNILEAVRYLSRVTRIIQAVAAEVDILATMPPREFHGFRRVLTPSSGFESLQFRELEFVSGLNDPTFLKLMDKYIGLDGLRARWPVTLREAAYAVLAVVDADPTAAWTAIYNDKQLYPEMFLLAEALSEYEVYFGDWRFHHIKLVERTIGDHVPGTAGSAGAGYLGRTLQYRFFAELWEARNRVTQMN
ncbi:MAG: tryptophan 2,3-dioxygenase family protein [Chloroflexota bacterium]